MAIFIDRKSEEILNALKFAPLFKKSGRVNARLAVAGEKIVTVLASGQKETENVAQEGDWVVTNPSGEKYILPPAKLLSRYEPTYQEGVYVAKGYCRAIRNPFGCAIEIAPQWGGIQSGDGECIIADVSDSEGNLEGEPYIIELKAFQETYEYVGARS
jgi:hypothetical protein